eukprot:CAMPEP_0116882338 /NCGR_PEP_ID=MMETSP0463-20121206/14543_1 /TAXON_ID=181622 /ORGANISM="Strombidinopsis sp, Strain SopsisLIS2011" /LENGTH=86 /DNA_ID=CAMNT_0004535369 /DNA_START=59 /DNA_END=319 /DNA_ORIENTATION=+
MDEEIEDMIKRTELSKQNLINMEEFLSMVARRIRETDTEDQILAAFKVFDKENTGLIPAETLRKVLDTNLSDKLSVEDLDEIMREA